MVTNKYLKWLSETDGYWWTDTAEIGTMDEAIENGATGVTTNPILVKKSLYAFPDFWRPYLKSAEGLSGDAKAEEIIRCITVEVAKKFQPIYEATQGVQGYVCAQVNPRSRATPPPWWKWASVWQPGRPISPSRFPPPQQACGPLKNWQPKASPPSVPSALPPPRPWPLPLPSREVWIAAAPPVRSPAQPSPSSWWAVWTTISGM